MVSCVIYLSVLCGLTGQASAESQRDWPQWRGPTRDGRAVEASAWPTSLNESTLRLRWRVKLGPSYSGPIVVGPLVYSTETQDRKQEVVRALDRATGEQRWEAGWDGALSVPFFAKSNGDWIRSTPACDGERLYVAGMRDLLVAMDARSGQTLWKIDFMNEFTAPLPAFGFVCSPLVDGDFVYVQAGAGCCKIEKQTGKVVWRALTDGGGMWGSAFSSPLMATLAQRRQLLVQTRERLAGLDPSTGTEWWSRPIPAFRGMNILTPTAVGDAVFTSSYGGKSIMLNVTGSDDGFEVNERWSNKTTGYMSTPVVIDGHAYLHLQNQRFTCIDLATGASRWTTPPFGKYWSLVSQGDRILALDERGDLRLIRATPAEFTPIDVRKISTDPTWAHLAVVGDEIYIRELNALAVYQWTEATP